MEIWDRIYDLYGRCSIVFTGGEPTIYPNFFEFVSKLSQKHYPINISSNGSGDLKKMVELCDNKKVSMSISFHTQFDTAEEVIKRAKYLKENGFLAEFVNYCCWPPTIPKLMECVKMFKEEGLVIKAIPFCGQYNGKNYPDSYTKEEKDGKVRVLLKLPENLAPYRFCVSPLLKNKPELVKKAKEVYDKLREKYTFVTWDDSGNIGKRYRKQDEIGTLKCVVIDFDTLEDDTVTVRDRDTTEQTRVKIAEL